MSRFVSAAAVLVFAGLAPLALHAQSSADAEEQAIRAAVLKVAPAVVQIETAGGTDIISSGAQGPQIRKGTGPTTGLVVGADGYVISSAFNFANKPSAIFVAVPGHKDRLVAKVIATDQTRMLTLLKIDAKGLPVPAAVPKKEMQVGQTALAIGRTWVGADDFPSISVGIISALGRIWGKAIQTDAKVSPVNYGGPLVDLRGRVLGVLVPASPRGQDETAGVEWYDSGIGFAIPLEDVYAVLPRLMKGQDLKRGLLGFAPKSPDIYGAAPIIAAVVPDSAAARAGVKAGDVITEIDGIAVTRQAQVMHLLGTRYEGDKVSVKVKRGEKELSLPALTLTGALTAFAHSFLGILPMRDDPGPGVEVRYVFPKSAAEKAGLKAGDRILGLGTGQEKLNHFSGRNQLQVLLNPLSPETEVKLEVRHKGAKDAVTLKAALGNMSDAIPDKLPEPATLKQALGPLKLAAAAPPPKSADKKPPAPKAETGLLKRTNAARDHEYWLAVPKNYDPNIAHALVIWLHPAGQGKDKDLEGLLAAWAPFAAAQHLILMAPKAQNETGWLASEADSVQEAVREVLTQYTIDRPRIVAHGIGIGGQMAFYLGFNARDLVRGVATVGAVVPGQPPDNFPTQRLAFFIAARKQDPLAKPIAEARARLAARKFAVTYRETPTPAASYLDAGTLGELVRWIDSLDRL